MSAFTSDYLIVGGGLSGCAIATRLKEYDPQASVTLLEAGPNEHNNPLMIEPMGTFQLHQSKYEYNYKTVPQKHYDDRQVFNAGGKQLSGSSSVNYAMWTREGAADYDLWADLVNNRGWSYEALLPYFKKTETHHDSTQGDIAQHDFDGPIHTTASARHYPLGDKMKQAFVEGTGLPVIRDANGGNPIGIAPYTENWRDGKRQPSGKAYGLAGVRVETDSVVRRIILENATAKGAEVVDGRVYEAKREVIVCCGAIRTPQMLLLSGIGPSYELARHDIQQFVNSPDVGKSFHDHCCLAQFYKISFEIKDPKLGLAAGAELWKDPTYLLGVPADMVFTASAPRNVLKTAMIADGVVGVDDSHPHLQPTHGHIEILPIYAPTEAPLTDLNVPFDGTCITIGVLNLLPTSRGSVRLASADPTEDPLIDPNYYATETDRAVMRAGIRYAISAVESATGRSFIAEEFTPEGFPPLTSTSSDEQIDGRVKRAAATWFHPAGSTMMGKVVDARCRVIGAKGLRVADPSILPCPIGAHYQVVSYAIAEKMAQEITTDWRMHRQ